MKVFGIDFTSRPGSSKSITCLQCEFDGGVLRAGSLEEIYNFTKFEQLLKRPGPWVAGIDFPFGQSRKFIENIGWPRNWEDCVRHVNSLDRQAFREALNDYREARPKGDKEHRRKTDIAAGSISPQKLYGVPVGLMFFEGAPRLIDANVTIPHLRDGDPERIVVEAYPGVLARALIGRCSYKNDKREKQTSQQRSARFRILNKLETQHLEHLVGFRALGDPHLADDPSGDCLDALMCAVQAAWAWHKRHNGFGAPREVDPLEGWISDPTVSRKMSSAI